VKADPELEELLRIARQAEPLVLEVYQSAFEVELKGPNDPVTRADREANELICRALSKSFPSDAIVAEESVPEGADEVRALTQQARVFFVDPVDGTREFANRNDEFCIMVGLAQDGVAVCGVVLEPTTGRAYCGSVKTPGFVESRDGARRRLVPSTEAVAIRLVCSRSHQPRIATDTAGGLQIAQTLRCGSVGLKVAMVARGDAEVYVHGMRGIKLWDTCAPDAILHSAGGSLTDLAGDRIDYQKPTLGLERGLAASTGVLRERLIAVTRPHCEERERANTTNGANTE